MMTTKKNKPYLLSLTGAWLVLSYSAAFANVAATKLDSTFTSVLTAKAEVGHKIAASTPKDVSGKAQFSYDTTTHQLRFMIQYHHLSGYPTMAHFHLAPIGENGPIIQTICGSPAPSLLGACPASQSATLSGVWSVPEQYRAALMQDKVFINFHTQLNPKGELRGQLSPETD